MQAAHSCQSLMRIGNGTYQSLYVHLIHNKLIKKKEKEMMKTSVTKNTPMKAFSKRLSAPATTPDGRRLMTVNITRPEAKPTTRLALEDLGYTDPGDLATDRGLKLTWTTGDRLGVYAYSTTPGDDSPAMLIGHLDLQPGSAGTQSGTFAFIPVDAEQQEVFDPENTLYSVVYPYMADKENLDAWSSATMIELYNIRNQDGASMRHLIDVCHMHGNNTDPNTGDISPNSFTLYHGNALMTVSMEAPDGIAPDEVPIMLTVTTTHQGVQLYSLNLTNRTDWSTPAYLMMHPVYNRTRDLQFEVVSNKGNVYSLLKTGLTKDYESGFRYTAALSGANALTLDVAVTADMSKPLASYTGGMTLPTSNMWIVNDVFTASSSLSGLKDALGAANNLGRLITLVMPQGTGIKDYALLGSTNLVAVYMPAAQAIGESAFASCTVLARASMPAAQTINRNTFASCTALASVSMPLVNTVHAEAFSGCTSLTSVSMPSVNTVQNDAFSGCTALDSVSMPSVKTVQVKAFSGCTGLTRMEIATAAGHPGLNIFGDKSNDVFQGVDLSQVDLILGAAEYGKVTGSGTAASWRPAYDTFYGPAPFGYGPFKSIINGQK